MAGFPDNGHVPRYQFFKLTKELAMDVSPNFLAALDEYGAGSVSPDTSVMEVIEAIANPVLRQAAPEITIGHMDYLIDFASICRPFLEGQLDSLSAYDPSLKDGEFNAVISEDALYLRQILSDTLYRVGAEEHPVYGPAINDYAAALVTTRDRIEFAHFESDLEDLEAVFLTDLDGRLARSNDVINQEMDREVLSSSIQITDQMNDDARRKRKQEALYTLMRILNGGG
jgi:hypothetical protein